MRWSDLKVKTKLSVLVTMTCAALVLVSALGIYGLRDTAKGIEEASLSLEQVSLMDRLKQEFLTVRLDLVYMIVLNDPARIEEKYVDMTARVKSIHENMKALFETNLEVGEKEQLKLFSEGFEAYLVQGEKLAAMCREGRLTKNEISSFATGTVAPLYNKPAETLSKLVESYLKSARDMKVNDMARAGNLTIIMVATSIISLLLAVGLGSLIIISINRPLRRVIQVLTTVASGDLKTRSGIDSRDEMGVLASEVDQMAEKLSATIGKLTESSIQVSVAAHRIHKLTDSLTRNSESLASQSTTIATASEEMAATSSDIARNCNDAAQEGKGANEVAASGAEVVDRTVKGMVRIAERVKGSAKIVEELGRRSNQIGEIIGTIEDIADQTNLLALNAAIEAARAGEQGRGFAVVADEVRALAERTTRATREIGEMIKAIQSETKSAVLAMEEGVAEVERGSEGAAQSGEALQQILQRIDVVTQQVNQIATAADEQTATTAEVSRNIMQVTDIAHCTSQDSRDITTEANQLTSLSTTLMDAIGSFSVEESNALIINKAKSAHIVFTGKIQAHLDGTSRIDPSTLPDHHGCNFGKWYDKTGTEHCGHLPLFRDIVAPHAKVHELGKSAIVAFNAGDRVKAAALCEEMVQNSSVLLGILEELEKKCA